MVRAAIPLPTGSNPGRSRLAGSQRIVNGFVEPGDTSKGKAPIYVAAGLSAFSDVPAGLCRGLYAGDNFILSVCGGVLYKTDAAGVSTQIGFVPGTDPVMFARNQANPYQVLIQCEAGLFVATETSVKRILLEDILAGLVSVAWLDSYFILARSDGKIYISGNDNAEFDALDFATAEGDPDGLIRAYVHGRELLLMGPRTIEVWTNTGASPFPFARLGGAVIQRGLGAKHSVCSLEGVVFFVDAQGIVRQMTQGYQAARVSNYELERLVEAEGDFSGLTAFAYTSKGHAYYVLSGKNFTWVYDATSSVWHERQSEGLKRWQANYGTTFQEKVIVGSLVNTKLYQVTDAARDEAGLPLRLEIVTPVVNLFPDGAVVHAVDIDVETGVGDETAFAPRLITADTVFISADSHEFGADQTHDWEGLLPDVPGTYGTRDPLIILYWSVDGGKTWKGGQRATLGRQGRYQHTVKFTRIGAVGRQGLSLKLVLPAAVARAVLAISAEATKRVV